MENGQQSAYPIFNSEGVCYNGNGGLTKREYFAAITLQGLIKWSSFHNTEAAASMAIEYADELLKQLEK